MNNINKIFIQFMLFVAFLVLAACGANEEDTAASKGESSDYPNKPIKLVVGFEAGGTTDSAARILAEELGKHFDNNVDVVVENKPGGTGIVAVTEVINTNPDGYTIGFHGAGPFTIQPHLGQTNYEYDDAVKISQTNSTDFLVVVKEDAPWDDFDSLLEDIQANPGEFVYGVPGAGSPPDIAMQTLKKETGVEAEAVPFQGGGALRTALLGDDVDFNVVTESDAIPLAESGEAKILLNLGQKKFENFPDVPTAQEKGYDINANVGFYFYGPKGLSGEIRDKIDEAAKKTVEVESIKESFEKMGLPLDYKNSEEAAKIIEEQYNSNGEVLADSEE